MQTTDNSGGGKSNPFPWWEGDTRVSTSPNGDVVSMVSGANRITYRYDEEMRLVEAQMATGDPVAITYDGGGNLVSIVQGATTQKTLTYQGRILQTRNAADVLQDRNFWVGSHFMRLNIDAAARNQSWDARGSNTLSYQTDGTMDKARLWDNWGLEVFAEGAGSAPDVGFLSNFDLAASGLSLTPRNNAWWAELGRSVEGGWRPRYVSEDGGDSCTSVTVETDKGPQTLCCEECTLFCSNAEISGTEGKDGLLCGDEPYTLEEGQAEVWGEFCGGGDCDCGDLPRCTWWRWIWGAPDGRACHGGYCGSYQTIWPNDRDRPLDTEKECNDRKEKGVVDDVDFCCCLHDVQTFDWQVGPPPRDDLGSCSAKCKTMCEPPPECQELCDIHRAMCDCLATARCPGDFPVDVKCPPENSCQDARRRMQFVFCPNCRR